MIALYIPHALRTLNRVFPSQFRSYLRTIHKKCDNDIRLNQCPILCDSTEPIRWNTSVYLHFLLTWRNCLTGGYFIPAISTFTSLHLRAATVNLSALKHRREIAERHGTRNTALATLHVTLITLPCTLFTLFPCAAVKRRFYDEMFITFVNLKICRIRWRSATNCESNVDLN